MIDRRFDLNLMVIGKSGAGKSSFCNYLFDEPDIFATGKGKPVTGWESNFANHRFERGGFSFNLFDSVGLEADNLPQWNQKFEAFLAERRPDLLASTPVEPGRWIHGIFYVLNASSGRIEPSETDLIKKAASYGAPIMLVLTNCDAAGPKIAGLREAVAAVLPKLVVHEVCSVEIRKRSGTTARFGRDEVLRDYIAQSKSTLAFKVARFTCGRLAAKLKKVRKLVVDQIEASDISVMNLSDFDPGDVFDLSTLERSYDSVDFFRDYLSDFGFDTFGDRDFHQEIEAALEKSFDDGRCAMESQLDSVSDRLENGTFLEKVAALWEVGKTALTIKSRLAEMIGEWFDGAIARLDELDRGFEREHAQHAVCSHGS